MFRNLSTFGLPLSGRPSELIELALSFGFDSMDIDLLDFQQQADTFSVQHARRLMVSARLNAGTFQLPVALGGDAEAFNRDLAALPRRLELAEATEAPRAVITIAPASDEHSFKDYFELYRTRLDTVGDLLAARGVSLGLAIVPEPEARTGKQHQFIHTLEGLIGLVAAAHKNIGVVIDAWALHVTGESLELIERVPKGRIIEVRLSDAPRDVATDQLQKVHRLMPGETGVINGAAVLTHAEQAGFDGPVTPWADRSTLVGRGREKLVKLAGDRLEAVWKEANLPILPRWFTPVAKEPGRYGETSRFGDEMYSGGDRSY
ncbi:MAG: TIM barrel protein [Planctomycetia bacterium]|nr:TIM barrel protein [Planctomycetia bacterium]RLT13328.1 MAG: sugar phosphate isomerase/epimerase [Planctomycetota bacterium]